MQNSELLLIVSKELLIAVSNYLGQLPYREVSNLISSLDNSLRTNNLLTSQPLDKYSVDVATRNEIIKYLYTRPYGEVFKYVHELENCPEDLRRHEDHKESDANLHSTYLDEVAQEIFQ